MQCSTRPLVLEETLTTNNRGGLHYDFQAVGEFVMSDSKLTGNSFQVQARLEPWFNGASVSVMTQISAAVGVLAAGGFATGERPGMVAGAVLLYFAFVLDCVDGQLARYTRQFSKLGAWLDSVFDRTKEYLVFAGLAIGASRTGDDVWLLAGAALTLQVMRHSIDFSYPQAQHQAMGMQRQPPHTSIKLRRSYALRRGETPDAQDARCLCRSTRTRSHHQRAIVVENNLPQHILNLVSNLMFISS